MLHQLQRNQHRLAVRTETYLATPDVLIMQSRDIVRVTVTLERTVHHGRPLPDIHIAGPKPLGFLGLGLSTLGKRNQSTHGAIVANCNVTT